MKKICILYGNCQIIPIIQYLRSSKSFNASYKIIEIPPVYLINQEKGLEENHLNSLTNCDLFIYQIVGQTYGHQLSTDYIISKLPAKCMKLSFPVSYFSGYYPQTIHIPTDLYADINIINLLKQGKNKNQIISILSDDNFYSYYEVKTNLEDTLTELQKRDATLDITIDDYVKQNYRNLNLFYTINHPSYYVTRYLSMKILDKLGLPKREISQVTLSDAYFMDRMQPIYPSVKKHLNLIFNKSEDMSFNFNYTPLKFPEYIAKHVDIHIMNMDLN
ncbi:WcbI family polysaccharide biosynthesis putative acetyltransferase [Priestia megaterium]|uniref:WcbI family polysaccharide biosynthesis putative acetyltransferase n=1 Tax=Priestia megaterium TaxID=1404 RepID=UPI0024529109|nr:WcbI family polysaccharide biosynthesis putative acetyltransferase [Priestia megaterium]MDH3183717.1 WcbI family polysaccharide biosynthesis putative acetyltransferase [Priestia megaterium]